MATTTAAARRQQDKIAYNALLAGCPTRQVMATVGGKWASLLVHVLATGPMRHSQLRTAVAGISQKMLTQTLRELERDGLLTRTVTPSVPVRVDYELTALGHSLAPVLAAVKEWSERNIEDVLAARDDFDRTQAVVGDDPQDGRGADVAPDMTASSPRTGRAAASSPAA